MRQKRGFNQGQKKTPLTEYDIVEKLDQLEHGFDDIEHRISNMDKEHSRYVKATVTRLNYLLNQEDNMKGLVIRLLNHLSEYGCPEEELASVSARMNLSQMTILSEKSLYKRRKTKADFTEQLKDEEESEELSMEEVLNLNKVRNRYSQKEIEAFIEGSMTEGKMVVDEQTIHSDQDFEKLILAYDYSTRRKSPYKVEEEDSEWCTAKAIPIRGWYLSGGQNSGKHGIGKQRGRHRARGRIHRKQHPLLRQSDALGAVGSDGNHPPPMAPDVHTGT